MKHWKTALSIFALFASLALADDFKTTNGKEYKNATVTRVEPDGIVIKFHGGIVKLQFTELPSDVQKKYGYDPQAAAAAAAATAAKQRQIALAQQQLSEQQQAAAEQAPREQTAARDVSGKSTHTIRELASDQPSFLDKPVYLDATIDIDDTYFSGYDGAEGTHYAFTLRDDRGSCHAYMERAKAEQLRKDLLDAQKPIKGTFLVVISSGRYENRAILVVELLNYRLFPE